MVDANILKFVFLLPMEIESTHVSEGRNSKQIGVRLVGHTLASALRGRISALPLRRTPPAASSL